MKYVLILKEPPHFLILETEDELKAHVLKYGADVVGTLKGTDIKRLRPKPSIELEEEKDN